MSVKVAGGTRWLQHDPSSHAALAMGVIGAAEITIRPGLPRSTTGPVFAVKDDT